MSGPASSSKTISPATQLLADTAIGAVAGVCEVSVNQPLIYFKNCLQTGAKIHWSPSHLYRGYMVNAGSLAPITAIQVAATTQIFSLVYKTPTHTEPSSLEKAVCAVGAGALSGLISGPSESVIVHQQKTGLGAGAAFSEMKKKAGIAGIYRGTSFAMFRDGLFTAGFMALGPYLAGRARESGQNEVVSRLLGGVGAGVVSAVLTHPADTIKTRLQGDFVGAKYKGVADVVREGGLFTGLSARGTRVIVGVCVISNVTDVLTTMFKKYMTGEQ